MSGAHRECAVDDDCVTVKLDCSHLDCSAVHRDHAAAYADLIDCAGYSGGVGNFDCDPRFDIEAPRCRDGCCVSENILQEPAADAAGPQAQGPAEPCPSFTGPCPTPCRKLGVSAPASNNGLEAYVSLLHCGGTDARELLINARVWNVSARTVRFCRMPTRYPMLVFELRHAGGELVPNGPPPVPPAEPEDDWWLDLAPDQDYLFDGALGQLVAVDLEPGDYELRFAYENTDDTNGAWVGKLETGWVRFTRRTGGAGTAAGTPP